MSSLEITKLAFEERYLDDSGIEFAVRVDMTENDYELEFERVGKVQFPIKKIGFIRAALAKIDAEICKDGND